MLSSEGSGRGKYPGCGTGPWVDELVQLLSDWETTIHLSEASGVRRGCVRQEEERVYQKVTSMA